MHSVHPVYFFCAALLDAEGLSEYVMLTGSTVSRCPKFKMLNTNIA